MPPSGGPTDPSSARRRSSRPSIARAPCWAFPADYRVGIVPASDTGAFEMAMWTLLGARPVDMLTWESFGEGWVTDVAKQLKLTDARVLKARLRPPRRPEAGRLEARRRLHLERHDLRREGARTATGSPPIARGSRSATPPRPSSPWTCPGHKLDVVTWSWQKVLGGEAAHGMLVLSPRAVQRLESYKPAWPLPKIFRLTKGGKLCRRRSSRATHQHALDAVRRGFPRRPRWAKSSAASRR